MVNCPHENDLVLLTGPDGKRFMLRLQHGDRIHTHLGYVAHDSLIDRPFGEYVMTHLGHPFLLLPPATLDLVMHLKRASQIVYPKDIGYILLKLNIIPGARVVEAGTGSGGLTIALARAVGTEGRVFSYEEREDMQAVARKNLARAGALDNVELKARDIRAGFDERQVDALFLDVREPWLFMAQAHAALKGGGFFGSLVPTANQVSELLQEMEQERGWAEQEVCEILLRFYKPVPERLRPADRMVAHTGYLVFARVVSPRMNGPAAGTHQAESPPTEVGVPGSVEKDGLIQAQDDSFEADKAPVGPAEPVTPSPISRDD